MPNTAIKVYDNFTVAQNAREQLLAAGFPPSNVHLSTKNDEAGPVEGNFWVGNKDDDTESFGDSLRSLFNSTEDPYKRDFSNVVMRGSYLLTVDADSDDDYARASDIMEQIAASHQHLEDAGDRQTDQG